MVSGLCTHATREENQRATHSDGNRKFSARARRNTSMERPSQASGTRPDAHDDLRPRRPAPAERSVNLVIRQPLHGAARREHTRRGARRPDGAIQVHARLFR